MPVRPAELLEATVRRARSWMARRRSTAAASFATVGLSGSPALSRTRELRQPDDTSCGASCLVFARMLHDGSYGSWVLDDVSRWGPEVRAMHRRVSGWSDHDGRRQWPWPRFVGTSPWAVARQMGGGRDRSGPGPGYDWRTLDPDDLGTEFDAIASAARAGHSVPLYVGNALRPAHVVLVVGADQDRLRVYEPSAGRLLRVGRDEFVDCRFRLGGWSVPWFAVLPR